MGKPNSKIESAWDAAMGRAINMPKDSVPPRQVKPRKKAAKPKKK